MKSGIEKHFAVLFLSLTLAFKLSAADDAAFRAGLAAYEAGRFDAAAKAFHDSLAAQVTPGALLNLGLAEWQRGRVGPAMLAWEQADWLDTFRPAARKNLLYARENLEINPPALTWYERASTWLPADLWTWLAGGSLWLAVGLVTLPGFFRMRKASWYQTGAALAFAIFFSSLAPAAGILTRSAIGIVTVKDTALRLTPTQAAERIAVLSAGEAVRELRQRGNYLLVHTAGGDGWIERGKIQFICPR